MAAVGLAAEGAEVVAEEAVEVEVEVAVAVAAAAVVVRR